MTTVLFLQIRKLYDHFCKYGLMNMKKIPRFLPYYSLTHSRVGLACPCRAARDLAGIVLQQWHLHRLCVRTI